MPTVTVTTKTEVAVKYLSCDIHVRYWEDADVNGVVDEDGLLIPCRKGNSWCPIIDLETGIIEGWPENTHADIHYKVCDEGRYHLLDAQKNIIVSIDGYVPGMMCPKDDGYGDYVIMEILGNGLVVDWKVDMKEFVRSEEYI